MNEVVQTVITALTSSGVVALIIALLNRSWAKSDKRAANASQESQKLDAVINGLKVLTVDRVRYLGERYIEAHEITLGDKENLRDMYDAYKKLGGNGHLETVMAEVDRLPVVGER